MLGIGRWSVAGVCSLFIIDLKWQIIIKAWRWNISNPPSASDSSITAIISSLISPCPVIDTPECVGRHLAGNKKGMSVVGSCCSVAISSCWCDADWRYVVNWGRSAIHENKNKETQGKQPFKRPNHGSKTLPLGWTTAVSGWEAATHHDCPRSLCFSEQLRVHVSTDHSFLHSAGHLGVAGADAGCCHCD